MQSHCAMKRLRTRGTSLLCVLAAGIAANCDRAPVRSPSDENYVSTWSGRPPHPDQLPPAVHTVDNAGFVDNGGRTSSDVDRTQMSGMRATEQGSQNFSATPGPGWPWPGQAGWTTPGKELPVALGQGVAPGAPAVESGVPASAVAQQLSEAACERDAACAQRNERHEWPNQASCLSRARERERERVETAGCGLSFDATKVSMCMAAIRSASCDTSLSRATALEACQGKNLCAQR